MFTTSLCIAQSPSVRKVLCSKPHYVPEKKDHLLTTKILQYLHAAWKEELSQLLSSNQAHGLSLWFSPVKYENYWRDDLGNSHILAEGLLAKDPEWESTIEKAATFKMPFQLSHMFVYICALEQPFNAVHLWETFKNDPCHLKDSYNFAFQEKNDILQIHELRNDYRGLSIPEHTTMLHEEACQQAQVEFKLIMKAQTTSKLKKS